MTSDLTGRHYLSELDFTAEQIHHLLDLAAELKAAKRDGTETPRLPSTRAVSATDSLCPRWEPSGPR
jgi:ornithine carbamoyltransferase